MKKGRYLPRLAAVALCLALLLLVVEALSQVTFRLTQGQWYWRLRAAAGPDLIQEHPYFGACNQPGISREKHGIRISHNSFRCRGREFARPKPPGLFRVVALGGSTTYCSGVSDDETWEVRLADQLGPGNEVINMGLVGGTSVEACVQTALLFSEVQPDVAIFCLGWNDARVQHVQGLWPDWSDYHGLWMRNWPQKNRNLSAWFASTYLARRAAYHWFFPGTWIAPRGTAHQLTDTVEQAPLDHYARNLRNIVALCQKQGVKVVFAPQVLNYGVLTSDKPYGWLPFVRDKDLRTYMDAYNRAMAEVAAREGVTFCDPILKTGFAETDFVDNGHFSAAGCRKFASLLAPSVRAAASASH